MTSYDPRQNPVSIIGYNCILPEYQGNGYGTMQLEELLKTLNEKGFEKIIVKTGDSPVFKPAQKMYLACGFKEVKKDKIGHDPRFGDIHYKLELKSTQH